MIRTEKRDQSSLKKTPYSLNDKEKLGNAKRAREASPNTIVPSYRHQKNLNGRRESRTQGRSENANEGFSGIMKQAQVEHQANQHSSFFPSSSNFKVVGSHFNSFRDHVQTGNVFINVNPGPENNESISVRFPTRSMSKNQRVETKDIEIESSKRPKVRKSSEIYFRHLLTVGRGSPLWIPEPSNSLPVEYQKTGIRIGDVGLLKESGGFDFLFNVYQPRNDVEHPVNPRTMPDGFRPLDTPEERDVDSHVEFKNHSFLTSSHVLSRHDTPSGFMFESSAEDGAILTMPNGANSTDLDNMAMVRKYVSTNVKHWYTYANETRGRDARNGDIRLVIGKTSTTTWGMAAFTNEQDLVLEKGSAAFSLKFKPSESGEGGTHASGARYTWECSGKAEVKSGPDEHEIEKLRVFDRRRGGEGQTAYENQCLFVRTINVTLGKNTVRPSSLNRPHNAAQPFADDDLGIGIKISRRQDEYSSSAYFRMPEQVKDDLDVIMEDEDPQIDRFSEEDVGTTPARRSLFSYEESSDDGSDRDSGCPPIMARSLPSQHMDSRRSTENPVYDGEVDEEDESEWSYLPPSFPSFWPPLAPRGQRLPPPRPSSKGKPMGGQSLPQRVPAARTSTSAGSGPRNMGTRDPTPTEYRYLKSNIPRHPDQIADQDGGLPLATHPPVDASQSQDPQSPAREQAHSLPNHLSSYSNSTEIKIDLGDLGVDHAGGSVSDIPPEPTQSPSSSVPTRKLSRYSYLDPPARSPTPPDVKLAGGQQLSRSLAPENRRLNVTRSVQLRPRVVSLSSSSSSVSSRGPRPSPSSSDYRDRQGPRHMKRAKLVADRGSLNLRVDEDRLTDSGWDWDWDLIQDGGGGLLTDPPPVDASRSHDSHSLAQPQPQPQSQPQPSGSKWSPRPDVLLNDNHASLSTSLRVGDIDISPPEHRVAAPAPAPAPAPVTALPSSYLPGQPAWVQDAGLSTSTSTSSSSGLSRRQVGMHMHLHLPPPVSDASSQSQDSQLQDSQSQSQREWEREWRERERDRDRERLKWVSQYSPPKPQPQDSQPQDSQSHHANPTPIDVAAYRDPALEVRASDGPSFRFSPSDMSFLSATARNFESARLERLAAAAAAAAVGVSSSSSSPSPSRPAGSPDKQDGDESQDQDTLRLQIQALRHSTPTVESTSLNVRTRARFDELVVSASTSTSTSTPTSRRPKCSRLRWRSRTPNPFDYRAYDDDQRAGLSLDGDLHPSSVINAFLLNSVPDADMAITEDGDWISVLQSSDLVFPSDDVLISRIREMYEVCVEDGVVFLRRRRRSQVSAGMEDGVEGLG